MPNLVKAKTIIQKEIDLNSKYLDQEDPRVSVYGETIHGCLSNGHEKLYKAILAVHINNINNPHLQEIKKIDHLLKCIVNGEKKIKAKIMQLSKKLITNFKEIQDKYTKGDFCGIKQQLSTAKQNEQRNVRANSEYHIKKINDQIIGDSTNFAAAQIIFVVTTKNSTTLKMKKTLSKSFPIKVENCPLYNYEQIKSLGLLKSFKDFLKVNYEASKEALSKVGIQLIGEGSTLDIGTCKEKYYPQIAFHSEKFFFYYLLEQRGLDTIVELLPTKSIEPQNIATVINVEIRMHSTRDICRTCEPVSIGAMFAIQKRLNELLTNKGYPPLCDNPIKFVITSSNHNNKSRGHTDNIIKTINLSMLNLADCSMEQKTILNQYNSRVHDYTFFTSGSNSQNGKAKKESSVHSNALADVREQDQKLWIEKELKAATKIQKVFRTTSRVNSCQA